MVRRQIVSTIPDEVVVTTAPEVVVATKKRERKPKEKKPKEPKQPSAYATFVKANYDKSRELPVKERFKFLATLWKKEKEKCEK